jgi:hypothetical protein
MGNRKTTKVATIQFIMVENGTMLGFTIYGM